MNSHVEGCVTIPCFPDFTEVGGEKLAIGGMVKEGQQWLELHYVAQALLAFSKFQVFVFFLAVFLTGSDRIPILGMKCLKLVIQPTGGGEDYLPVAHTCFNLLDLPKYTDKETLKSKLIQAIDHYEGFSLV